MDEKRYVLVVTVDGPFVETLRKEIPQEDWGNVGYETISEAVGGLIDCVAFKTESGEWFDMWVNDEFLILPDLELNPIATAIMRNTNCPIQVVLGNILIAKHDEEGYTTAMTEEQCSTVMNHIFDSVLGSIEDYEGDGEGEDDSPVCE